MNKPIQWDVLLIWSTVVLAFICIAILFTTRDTIRLFDPLPPVARNERLHKPGTEDIKKLQHQPTATTMPVVKHVGDEDVKK